MTEPPATEPSATEPSATTSSDAVIERIDHVVQSAWDLIELLRNETAALDAGDNSALVLLAERKKWQIDAYEGHVQRLHQDLAAASGTVPDIAPEALALLKDSQDELAATVGANLEALAFARSISQRVVEMIGDAAQKAAAENTLYGATGQSVPKKKPKAAPVSVNTKL